MDSIVYVLVMEWLVAIPSSRYVHIARWQLGNVAWHYLDATTVASSPSRQAAVRLAMRFFLLAARGDLREHREESWAEDRRIYRAIRQTRVGVNPRGSVVDWVRMLSRHFIVEQTVSLYARRDHGRGQPSRERAIELYEHGLNVTQEDVDSSDGELDSD